MTTTTPATKPESEIQKIEADVKKVYTWGISHIVLVCMLAAALCGCFYLYDNRRAQAADARAAIAELKGQTADAANIKYQAATETEITNLQQQNTNLQSQLVSITAQMSARDSALAKQQQIISTMPPSQLAGSWQDAIKIQNSVTPESNGDYQVTQNAAVATVQALISVGALTQDKASLTSENTNLTTQLSNETTEYKAEAAAHQKDNTTCTTDKKALNDTIAKNKADYKKSRWHWFIAGYISGFVTKVFVK